jgi:hypothetical protein
VYDKVKDPAGSETRVQRPIAMSDKLPLFCGS